MQKNGKRFYADPSIRKLSSKLNKLVEMYDVHQIYMPEIPAPTYSTLQTKGLSLYKALDGSTRDLRIVERIRLRNLAEQLKADFVPILEKLFAAAAEDATNFYHYLKTTMTPRRRNHPNDKLIEKQF